MCGIYGIWHLDGRPLDLRVLRTATDRLRHRGPDDEGYLLAETRAGRVRPYAGVESDRELGLPPIERAEGDSNLAFGFRRLAILDLSSAGHQPMATPDGRLWIVFNGEVYNYIELRDELAALGHAFRSGSDTEVILAAYAQWGEACLHRLNGMWAFAIWDREERTLFLARDRFGIKPLYYQHDGVTFAFASEIKALVGSHGLPFAPDARAVYRFLVNGVLPSAQAGHTFFEGVQAVPPGCTLTVRDSGATLARYWQLPTPRCDAPLDRERVIEQYRELFLDAVRLQLRSDVPVGTCLSGGVDSSSIVCAVNWLLAESGMSAAQIGERQKTFSAVYESEGRYNERRFIEVVLRATGADGTFAFPGPDGLREDMQLLAWHQEEPFQSTSIFAQWCVMRAVRARGVTVLLDGQGADEVLAGYQPHPYQFADLLRTGRLGELAAETLSAHVRTGSAFSRLLPYGVALALPRSVRRGLRGVLGMRRSSEAPIRADLAFQYAPALQVAELTPAAGGMLDAHQRDILQESSLPTLLRYEDRNAMAFGVEARVPFLDHRLVEFAFGPAAHLRVRRGWTKWVHRQAMAGLLPDAIAWRSDKVGFETPEADWQRALLASCPDILADGALSGAYLDLAAARKLAATWAVQGGDTRRIWRWLSLEAWLRAWAAS
jgi:asparagine synthase (glutamine-hydrolysing)